jgi:phage terminase Nu1 subunit (DNA packaging protein)
MAVASGELLSAGKGAELIRKQTGRACSRQNLEKLVKQGKLPRSTACAAPVRVRADVLVDEYLSSIDARQAVREKPGVKQEMSEQSSTPKRVMDRAPSGVPSETLDDGELPAYTVSQQRKAFEQANLLELERREKEGQLIERASVEATLTALASEVRTKLIGLPSRARQRIPHLTTEEIAILTDLMDEALESLAKGGEEV